MTSKDIKIHFLGTNGWYSSPTGNTTCLLLETDDFSIILDAGNGLHKIDRFVKEDKDTYLFLSHFHIDHISGLHTLAKNRFPKGLKIICHVGGKIILDNVIRQPYTIALEDLPYDVTVIELTEGRHDIFPFGLVCQDLIHSTTCYGYRFEIGDKVISYCTDTGKCASALELSQNADILITECAHRPGETSDSWPHLNPQEAAEMAREAAVKRLVLMHFDANAYPTKEARQEAERIAQDIFPQTTAAYDDMSIRV